MPTGNNAITFTNYFLNIKVEIGKSCLPLFPLFSKTLTTNTEVWIITCSIEGDEAINAP